MVTVSKGICVTGLVRIQGKNSGKQWNLWEVRQDLLEGLCDNTGMSQKNASGPVSDDTSRIDKLRGGSPFPRAGSILEVAQTQRGLGGKISASCLCFLLAGPSVPLELLLCCWQYPLLRAERNFFSLSTWAEDQQFSRNPSGLQGLTRIADGSSFMGWAAIRSSTQHLFIFCFLAQHTRKKSQALRRLEGEDCCKLKPSPAYIASSRPTWATKWDLVPLHRLKACGHSS